MEVKPWFYGFLKQLALIHKAYWIIKIAHYFWKLQDETAAFVLFADYIANMTDEYAHRMHERLYGFNTRTIFERL